MGWDPMIEICEFWNALWNDAWGTWDGLWLFQVRQRPIDRALSEPRFVEVLGLG